VEAIIKSSGSFPLASNYGSSATLASLNKAETQASSRDCGDCGTDSAPWWCRCAKKTEQEDEVSQPADSEAQQKAKESEQPQEIIDREVVAQLEQTRKMVEGLSSQVQSFDMAHGDTESESGFSQEVSPSNRNHDVMDFYNTTSQGVGKEEFGNRALPPRSKLSRTSSIAQRYEFLDKGVEVSLLAARETQEAAPDGKLQAINERLDALTELALKKVEDVSPKWNKAARRDGKCMRVTADKELLKQAVTERGLNWAGWGLPWERKLGRAGKVLEVNDDTDMVLLGNNIGWVPKLALEDGKLEDESAEDRHLKVQKDKRDEEHHRRGTGCFHGLAALGCCHGLATRHLAGRHRIADLEGHIGFYLGPLLANRAHGIGILSFEDRGDHVFLGEFRNGRQWRGICYLNIPIEILYGVDNGKLVYPQQQMVLQRLQRLETAMSDFCNSDVDSSGRMPQAQAETMMQEIDALRQERSAVSEKALEVTLFREFPHSLIRFINHPSQASAERGKALIGKMACVTTDECLLEAEVKAVGMEWPSGPSGLLWSRKLGMRGIIAAVDAEDNTVWVSRGVGWVPAQALVYPGRDEAGGPDRLVMQMLEQEAEALQERLVGLRLPPGAGHTLHAGATARPKAAEGKLFSESNPMEYNNVKELVRQIHANFSSIHVRLQYLNHGHSAS